MNEIGKHPARDFAYRLIGPDYLPPDEDECALRDAQQGRQGIFRPLKASEIDQLTQGGNTATDWGTVLVGERFNPKLVRGCRFYGLVRIGDQENLIVDHEGLRLPVGLYYSAIISCDLGRNVVVAHADYLAHTLIGDEVIIHRVGRMQTTRHAAFGHGGLREGENEDERRWLEVANENGRRAILAYPGMLSADAYLWSKYRDEPALMAGLKALTDAHRIESGGLYGMVGQRTVIRNCGSIVNVMIGSDAVLDGAERLFNVTILSDAEEGTRIGSGVDLEDGIVGSGCRVDSGAKAFRFVLGERSSLHYGARLIHTFLGDNSTVSCCEVLNSLIFSNHEQHHNNSFLIATMIQGQSNIAAGATIGSNHNSRGLDGEIVAGRGFWPGLCSSYKHPSRFATFTLVAKGDYPYELNIPLPFGLVSLGEREDCLQLIPAYAFLYNMYAVMRNAWKFKARDGRAHPEQHLEFDYLAPDTVEEMFGALELLERWTAQAWMLEQGRAWDDATPAEQQATGRELLLNKPQIVNSLAVLGEGVENSTRPVRVLKAAPAYGIYRDMIHYYAVRTLLQLMEAQGEEDPLKLSDLLEGDRETCWVNLGGQLVAESDLRRLKDKIAHHELSTWPDVHEAYDALWRDYPMARARHAFASLLALHGLAVADLNEARWGEFMQQAVAIQDRIATLTQESRAKDYTQPFRRITFASQAEMDAVLGTVEENTFIAQVRAAAERFRESVARLMKVSA